MAGEDDVPDYRKLAADKWPGFQIKGNGGLVVVSLRRNAVFLFDNLLMANATGGKVIELKEPERPRVFRKPSWAKMLQD